MLLAPGRFIKGMPGSLLTTAIAAALFVPISASSSLAAGRLQQASAPAMQWAPCSAPVVGACFTHRGRLSSQNGIAYMLWLVGTKRIVAVDNGEMPGLIGKYLEMTSPHHSDIFGDYTVCPIEADRPGHMRRVCIAGASRLVVQDRARSRPPMRLLATWPAGK